MAANLDHPSSVKGAHFVLIVINFCMSETTIYYTLILMYQTVKFILDPLHHVFIVNLLK